MTTRRRPLRSVQHANLPATRRNQLLAAATSPAAKAAYVVIGSAGLAALAIAIFGPKRFQRQVLSPVRNAVSDQASQLWADSGALREQIGKLFARAQAPGGRERLVRNFQSWIGHFRAT